MLRWFHSAQVVKQRFAHLSWNELLVSTCEDAAAKAANQLPMGKPTFVDRRNTHLAARAQKGSAAMKEILEDFAGAAKRAGKRIIVVVDLVGNVGDMADACYTRHREAWIATKTDPNPSAYVRPPAETQHLFHRGYCPPWPNRPLCLASVPHRPMHSVFGQHVSTWQRGRSSAWRPGKRNGPLPGHVFGRGPTTTSTQRSSPFQAHGRVACLVVSGASVEEFPIPGTRLRCTRPASRRQQWTQAA